MLPAPIYSYEQKRAAFERETLLGEDISFASLNHKNFPEIIGASKSLEQVLSSLVKMARSESSVLILGESGTGKELVAAALHRLSNRAAYPFVALNCSAIPEDLLEAELFGHEKGAYTGADKKRMGHFGAAEGGTLFLDEIGDMPLRLQAKILRVLQEHKYIPLGSHETRQVNVRVVAATNKNLDEEVKEKKFRLDLFYRLNVLPIKMPPLRDRVEDIPVLLDHFLERMQRLHPHKTPSWFHPEAIEVLKHYAWPGNIRELQNLVERLYIIHDGGCIYNEELPQEFKHHTIEKAPLAPSEVNLSGLQQTHSSFILPAGGLELYAFIADIEDKFITQALERTGNNKNQAAKLLGLNRTTLVEKLRRKAV